MRIGIKLTDEEKKIVEENHNLIYSFIHSRGLDVDEYYGLIAESLCKTAKNLDKSKGTISTLFYTIATRDLFRHWRDNKKHTDIDFVQLNEEWMVECGDIEEEVEINLLVDEILESKYGEIFKLRLDGYRQEEIGNMLGVSQVQISRLLKEVGEKYFNRIG